MEWHVPMDRKDRRAKLIVQNQFAFALKTVICSVVQWLYFQSFLIDMFFSESFCITYELNESAQTEVRKWLIKLLD